MLFAASALVTKSHLAPYRFEILTALWCRYKRIPDAAFQQPELVDYFAFGLFGRHTTRSELRTWREGCQKWLGEGGSDQHDAQAESHTRHHTRDLTAL
jgi:hypothetical protein